MTDELKIYFQRCLDGMAGCTKSSTAHGVNHVANSSHPIIRVFWLLAFAAGTGIFLLQFNALLERFMSNPVSVAVNYRVVDFMFPDVTFCPLLPFSIRVMEAHNATKLLEKVEHFGELEPFIEHFRLPADNFVLSCRFFGSDCKEAGVIKMVEDARYKHCYTFVPHDRRPHSTVPQDALDVILFAENNHMHRFNFKFNFTIPSEWQTAGVRFVVHPPRSQAHPATRGTDVAPGTSSLISLDISRITQLVSRGCISTENVTVCDLHNQTKFSTYSFAKEDCYAEKIQERVLAKCGCLSNVYEVEKRFCRAKDSSAPPYPSCGKSDNLTECHNALIKSISQNFADQILPVCPYMCSETRWTPTIHTTTWPSAFAERQVLEIFNEVETRLRSRGEPTYLSEFKREEHGENSDKLRTNLLRLTIFPQMLSGNEENQEEAYPTLSFLGEVGGILGLWLGCSVLTFFEPIELLLHAITPFCMRQAALIQQKSEQLRAAVEERTTAFRSAMDQHTAAFRSAVNRQSTVTPPNMYKKTSETTAPTLSSVIEMDLSVAGPAAITPGENYSVLITAPEPELGPEIELKAKESLQERHNIEIKDPSSVPLIAVLPREAEAAEQPSI